MRRAWTILILLWALPGAAQDVHSRLSAEVGIEGRLFLHEADDPRQERGDVSLYLLPEYFIEWNNRRTAFVFSPFARIDSADSRRTHADIRELYLRHGGRDWELRAGVRKVFWGATESVHLVDVINQTDLIDNPDGEDKLGQPMVNLAWFQDWGTLDLFALPYPRQRTFPGPDGRLRFPLPVDDSDPVYESSAGDERVDWALRYSTVLGPADLGIAHFTGTARAPRFAVSLNPDGSPRLRPVYDLIDQTSLDLTAATGGWLWKLEALRQKNRVETYFAAAGGFEYTFIGVFGGPADVGWLTEYLWDERGKRDALDPRGSTPFDNDLFLGTRLAANDIAGSELLAGAIVDLDNGAVLASIEASRRLGPNWKLIAEMRLFNGVPRDDPTFVFRKDDYLGIELQRFF